MKHKELSGMSIEQSFKKFNKENPHVYKMFSEQCLIAIKKGKSKISSKAIINWMRWEIFMQTNKRASINIDGKIFEFKINDAYTSRYARLFLIKNPKYMGIFDLRQLRSA